VADKIPAFMCETISAAASQDGKWALLDAHKGTETRRVGLPATEISSMLAVLFTVLRDCYKNSGSKEHPIFNLRGLKTHASPDDPQARIIELTLQSDAPGLFLRVDREKLISMAKGIVEAEEALVSQPTELKQ
jgi:hypothetical protein